MSETSMFTTDDAAWTAAMDAARYAERRSDIVAKAVGAAAPLIVAAELRRLADKIGGTDYGRVAAQVMHQRADELDPS